MNTTTETPTTLSKRITKENKKLLENYEKMKPHEIAKTKPSTHLRYFSAQRDEDHKVKKDSDGNTILTFKRGGFLKKKKVTIDDDGKVEGWVILTTKPLNPKYHSNKKKAIDWSVPVCDTTIFYRVKQKKTKDEIMQERFEEQDMLIRKQAEELKELRKEMLVNQKYMKKMKKSTK